MKTQRVFSSVIVTLKSTNLEIIHLVITDENTEGVFIGVYIRNFFA